MSRIRLLGVKAAETNRKDSLLLHAPYNPHCDDRENL